MQYLHWETLSSLSDLRRTRHFHGLKRRESEANFDLDRSSGKLFQLLIVAPVGVFGPLPPLPWVPLLCA